MSSGHKPSLCPFDQREGGKECLGKAGKVSTGIDLSMDWLKGKFTGKSHI